MPNLAILPPPFKAAISLNSDSARSIRVRLHGGGTAILKGRLAFTMRRLMEVGRQGTTPQEFAPGLRLADYIFFLKRDGVPIDTAREKHAGPFPGQHARYRHSAPVEIDVDVEPA